MKDEADIERFKKQFGGFKYIPSFGSGIFDSIKSFASEAWRRVRNFFAGINEMSPTLKRFLSTLDANSPIQAIEVSRAPIASMIKKVMNLISLGQLEKNQKQFNYDDIYHLVLSIQANGHWYSFDRRPRVVMAPGKLSGMSGVDTSKIQTRPISLNGKKITIAEMFKNAINAVGQQKLFSYSGTQNNCQDFVIVMLRASGLLTPGDREFILQDTEKLLQNTGILPKVADGVTGLKHRLDGLLGQGRTKVQSVYFGIERWPVRKAETWLAKHGFHPIKEVHVTDRFLRYRIKPPTKGKRYITKRLPKDISLVLEY